MDKTLYRISMLVIGISFFLMGYIIYWMVWPYKLLEFKDKEFPVLNKQVYQGELVSYTSRYCKYTDLSATVVRNFVDTLIYSMPETTTHREKGCHELKFTILIPKQLPPGTYFIQILYKYEPNPIRDIVIMQNTEKFEVLEATGSAK